MNIYQLKQDLLSIFDELEENGGELTPELEESLNVTQEAFKDKIEGYTNVIKLIESDLFSIKVEQKRLKELADRKQKTIDRIKTIIIEAVEEFGDTKKSGAKFIDYGTGSVSVRKNKAVDVDKSVLERIGKAVMLATTDAKATNQLDVIDRLDSDMLLQFVAQADNNEDTDANEFISVNESDLRHTNIELGIKVSLANLIDGTAYPILKEMAKRSYAFDITPSVSRTDIKKELEINGACAPNLAKLVVNKSIIIK